LDFFFSFFISLFLTSTLSKSNLLSFESATDAINLLYMSVLSYIFVVNDGIDLRECEFDNCDTSGAGTVVAVNGVDVVDGAVYTYGVDVVDGVGFFIEDMGDTEESEFTLCFSYITKSDEVLLCILEVLWSFLYLV